MKIDNIPANELVLDYDLYPRHTVDSMNVRGLRDAYDAGVKLPPVRADRTSKRVTDGFHRVSMYLAHDPATLVPTELRDYASETEMLEDAIAANAEHGLRLSSYDRSRCLLLADRYGLAVERVATALRVNMDVLGQLRARKTAFDSSGNPLPIKRTLRHLAGSQLNERQQHANKRASGWSVRFHADQILNAIAGGIVPDDAPTLEVLRRLDVELGQFLQD